jgi:hypothetical protein
MTWSIHRQRFALCRRKRLVERGFPNLQARRRLANVEALGHQRARSLQLVGGDHRFAAPLSAACRGCGESGSGPLTDQVAFELSERAERTRSPPPGRTAAK